ncbi:MAG: SGNH/GDSL hydrolase family protein [Bacteroidota bacterium]
MAKTRVSGYIVSAATVLLFWGILEIICGWIYKNLPARFLNGKRIVEINSGRKDAVPSSIVSHPYMLYANKPLFKDSVQQHNSLGYRNAEFSVEKGDDVIRILTLGGSTTYGYLNKDPNSTWPAILQKKLQPHFTKKIEVINGGLKYATSAELLAGYIFRHRYIKPDYIIFHEGGNDAVPVFFDEYDPEYYAFRGHGRGAALRKGERVLLNSNVFKVFYCYWLNNYETVYRSQPYPFYRLDRAEVMKRIKDDHRFVGFTRNVDLLIRTAKADSVQVILFGFLQAREENLSKNRIDHAGLEKAMIYAVQKNNDILKQLSEKHNLLYIDPHQDYFKDEWFLDNCHLTKAGEEAKAEVVFQQIVKVISE